MFLWAMFAWRCCWQLYEFYGTLSLGGGAGSFELYGAVLLGAAAVLLALFYYQGKGDRDLKLQVLWCCCFRAMQDNPRGLLSCGGKTFGWSGWWTLPFFWIQVLRWTFHLTFQKLAWIPRILESGNDSMWIDPVTHLWPTMGKGGCSVPELLLGVGGRGPHSTHLFGVGGKGHHSTHFDLKDVFLLTGLWTLRETNVLEPELKHHAIQQGKKGIGFYFLTFSWCMQTYIYVYTWNPSVLCFASKIRVFSKQNKGHLGSRYIYASMGWSESGNLLRLGGSPWRFLQLWLLWFLRFLTCSDPYTDHTIFTRKLFKLC